MPQRTEAQAVGGEQWRDGGCNGGGIRAGSVYGATDRIGAYPTSNPVSPADFVATIYHLLGIDPHRTVPDSLGRPLAIAHGGSAIQSLLA